MANVVNFNFGASKAKKIHVIHQSKMPKSSYFLYKMPGFSYDTCRVVYIGFQSLFEDFKDTLSRIQDFGPEVACMLFQAGTDLTTIVNEIEYFLSGTRLELKVMLDVTNIFKSEGYDNAYDFTLAIGDYLLANLNGKFTYVPPVMSKVDGGEGFDDFIRLQVAINQLNIDMSVNPVFPFRWVSRKKLDGRYLFNPSCWDAAGEVLNKKGTRSYFLCIWKYILESMDAEFQSVDITSKMIKPDPTPEVEVIEEPQIVAANRGRGVGRGRHTNRGRDAYRGRDVYRGRGIYRGRGTYRGNGPLADRIGRSWRADEARLTIAKRTILRQFDLIAKIANVRSGVNRFT